MSTPSMSGAGLPTARLSMSSSRASASLPSVLLRASRSSILRRTSAVSGFPFRSGVGFPQ